MPLCKFRTAHWCISVKKLAIVCVRWISSHDWLIQTSLHFIQVHWLYILYSQSMFGYFQTRTQDHHVITIGEIIRFGWVKVPVGKHEKNKNNVELLPWSYSPNKGAPMGGPRLQVCWHAWVCICVCEVVEKLCENAFYMAGTTLCCLHRFEITHEFASLVYHVLSNTFCY